MTRPWSAARGYAVTSVDTMVDGVHFRRSQLTSEEIGHRALGGRAVGSRRDGRGPRRGAMALGLPPGSESELALALIGGAQELATRCGVSDRRRRRDQRSGAVRLVRGRSAGATIPANSSGATARVRATSSASPARWEPRGQGSRWLTAECSSARSSPARCGAATRVRNRGSPGDRRWPAPEPAR